MTDIILCPPSPAKGLPLRTPLAVGFGVVSVWRNGKCVWNGDDERVLLRRFDRRADRERGRWIVEFDGPLQSTKYQRIKRKWVLVASGMGFA